MIKKYFQIVRENKFVILFSLTERLFFFLIFLIIARKFPVEVYGELVTVFSIANIFIILFDLGLPVILQREVSILKRSSAGILTSVFIINLIFLPVYFLMVTLYSKIFFGDISFLTVCYVSLTVYLFSISNLFNKALSGLNDFRSQFKSLMLSRSLTFLAFAAGIFLFDAGLNLLLIILFAGAAVQIFSLIRKLRSNGLKISLNEFQKKKIKSIIRASIPLGLAVVFNFLYDKIDIVLISKLTDFDQTAYYNVAYGIFKGSAVAYTFLFASGLTRISFLSRNKKAVRLFLRKNLLTLAVISGLLTIILFSGADYIIKIIYSDKFAESKFILKLLSFAAVGLALNNLTGITLNGLGLFRQNMNVTLIGLIINVILNLIFIPVYGIAAAAIVTIITEYFIFAGDYFYLKKFLKQ